MASEKASQGRIEKYSMANIVCGINNRAKPQSLFAKMEASKNTEAAKTNGGKDGAP